MIFWLCFGHSLYNLSSLFSSLPFSRAVLVSVGRVSRSVYLKACARAKAISSRNFQTHARATHCAQPPASPCYGKSENPECESLTNFCNLIHPFFVITPQRTKITITKIEIFSIYLILVVFLLWGSYSQANVFVTLRKKLGFFRWPLRSLIVLSIFILIIYFLSIH